MYLRDLIKLVAFKFGGYVIEIRPSLDRTIVVRRKRSKQGICISIREVFAALRRVRAPKGWVPEVGQEVAVLPRRHRARVLRVVDVAGGPWVVVRFPKGHERTIEKSQLVPVGYETIVIRCERIPRGGTTESEPTLFRPVP